MGSNFFLTRTGQYRFSAFPENPTWGGGAGWAVHDFDQRRSVTVLSWKKRSPEFIIQTVSEVIDELPKDITFIKLSSEDGRIESTCSDPLTEAILIPYYPPRTDYPRRAPTLRRGDLTEVDRLGKQVDLVTYTTQPGETKTVVFKYYFTELYVPILWHELNCLMRMPRHPNIVPFHSLVLDSIDGQDRVVGFTTPYVPGGTLAENMNRLFKLKYLKQLISVSIFPSPPPLPPPTLMLFSDVLTNPHVILPPSQAVDYLNLHLGIVHGDLAPWSLLVDPETDSIQLIDFNWAAKLGWEGDIENFREFGYDDDRDDVKYTILTLYEIITREVCFRLDINPRQPNSSKIMRKAMRMAKWEKHKDTRLDSPVEEYRRVLSDWVAQRAKTDKDIDHFTKASRPLSWPPLFLPPVESGFGNLIRRQWVEHRSTCKLKGLSYLRWERPPTRSLPLLRGQHLLSTGEIISHGRGQQVSEARYPGGNGKK